MLRLEAEGLHFGFLVDVVLAGVAEAVFKVACFSGQGPYEAFACGQGLRGAVENFVLEGEGGVDPLPASGLKGGHYVGEDQGVKGVVVNKERVANVAAENVDGELSVEGCAVEEMRDEVVAIGLDVELGFFDEAVGQALVDVPIGSVDGDVADVIAAF